jgi:hypothetical protein
LLISCDSEQAILKASNILALKEHASILELLARGSCIAMLKKSGVAHLPLPAEAGQMPEFFLFPGYLGSSQSDLQTRWHGVFQQHQQPERVGMVRFRLYAQLRAEATIHDVAALNRLEEEIPLTPQYLRKRFEFPPQGLSLLVLRVYRLAEPLMLVDRPMYESARNWVKLETALPVRGLTPVVADQEFELRVSRLRSILCS